MNLCQGEELRPVLESCVGHRVDDTATFIGQWEDGKVTAVAAFSDWKGFDVELSLWSGGRLSRRFLRKLWEYAFEELGCCRVTARTSALNARCRDVLERCGFRVEGVRRLGLDGTTDLLLFGMTREEFSYREETSAKNHAS